MRDPHPEKSTNVRAPAPPLALRVGLAMTSAVSPALAALAAERLFLMPPRRRSARGDRIAPSRGEPFVIPFGRGRLQAWSFGEGPAVLLLHGWGGSAGQFAPFVAPLVAAGCSVVAFDAPAHGGSTGTLASIPAFADALQEVARRVDARAAIGHSFGAAGIAWALGGGLRLDAAVLVSPPRSPAEFFGRFCDAFGLSQEVHRAVRTRLERRFGAALEDFEIPGRVASTSTPLLVVHDRDDREVPWSDGAAIARAAQGAPLLRTEGLGHRRILRDPSVAASATAFVAKHLVRCGCGRLAERDAGSVTACAQCALERDLYDRTSRRKGLGAA